MPETVFSERSNMPVLYAFIAVFLLISAPAMAQESARDYIDRMMRTPPPPIVEETVPAPADDPAAAPVAEQEETLPAESEETEEVVAAEEPEAEEEACTPIVQDFSNQSPSIAKRYTRRQAEIDKMDTDCDGILQPEERTTAIETQFSTADADEDGVLSKAEAAAIIDAFKENSQGAYGGLIDKKTRKLEVRIKNMDKNDDGKITAAEYRSYYQSRYKSLDKNNDGALDVREFKTDVESRRRRSD